MWNPVTDDFIPTDLETVYLHLRTNSAEGSYDTIVIRYSDDEGEYAGALVILFMVPGGYALMCQLVRPFPTSLPTERDKHWMIEKRGNRTVLYCNGEQVLDDSVSSATCDDEDYFDTWVTIWGREVSSIHIERPGAALVSYYIG